MTQAPRVICPFWFLAQVPLQVLLELAEERALVELAEHPLEVHKVAAANAHAHHELRELQGEGGMWQFAARKYGFVVTNGSLSTISAMVFSS